MRIAAGAVPGNGLTGGNGNYVAHVEAIVVGVDVDSVGIGGFGVDGYLFIVVDLDFGIHFFPCAVDFRRYPFLRAVADKHGGDGGGRNVAVWFNHVHTQKGVHAVLECFKHVGKRLASFGGVAFGNDSEHTLHLQAQADE